MTAETHGANQPGESLDLHRLIEKIPALVVCALPDGSFEFVNRAWQEYTGSSLQQLRGFGWQSAIHPDDIGKFIDEWGMALTPGKPFQTEARIRRADGKYRWFFIRKALAVSPDQGGESSLRTLVACEDINDRKEAQAELQQSEMRLQAFLENSPNLIFMKDRQGRYLYANKEFKRAHRVAEEQIEGKKDDELFSKEQAAAVQANDRLVLEAGAPMEFEQLSLQHDGQHTSIVHKFPLFDTQGKIYAIGGIATDITERKREESARRYSEQRHRLVVETASDAVLCMDEGGLILLANPAATRIFGYDAAELIGKPLTILMPEIMRQLHETGFRRYLATGHRHVNWQGIEFSGLRKDGEEFPVEVSFGEQIRDGHREFTGFLRDISEKKTAEESLRRSAERLRLLVEGTASVTGRDFFEGLVQHMAMALRARYAFLSVCDDRKHARVLALWKGDGFGENFEFDIADTPCQKVLHGEVCHYREGLQALFPRDKYLVDWHAESYLGVPMLDSGGRVIGHIAVLDDKPMEVDSKAIDLVKIFASRASAELKRQQAEDGLHAALQEIKELKDQLYRENLALRDEIDRASMFEEIVGTSAALQDVLDRIAKVAPTDSSVLITGETGTGKELIARALHKRSKRSERAFVSVNCAALAPSLISSELFGHEKGAYTGATQRRLGRFELADGGTIFLDEVGELPPDTQVALLRVLQERQFERVGGTQPINVDVRLIAATNRDLRAATSSGAFRPDLFYRLNVFPIEVPPLRERTDDILILLEYFVKRYATQAGKNFRAIDKKTLELFQSYEWPGNIRELQNIVERSVILCSGDVFSVDHSWLYRKSSHPASRVQSFPRLDDKPMGEREMIEAALAESRGRVAGPAGAAAKLGIPPTTLYSRIKALHIHKSQFKFG